MPLAIGKTLQQRYHILSLLGQGGMGAVYRAHDLRLNVIVAVKELTPQPELDARTLAQLREQFRQEALTLARLSHPNLARVTDFFEEGGNAYLVMDFVQGESLARRIERTGALPEAEVLYIARQLLDALAYCHGQRIIHRDVKPQNVILRPDGTVVLVDFGLVKLWNPYDPRTQTAIRALGTPEYAPPEQYDPGGHTDPRSDLYSLAATLYHALTGQAPPTATMRIVQPEQLRPIRQWRPEVSPQTEAVLMRALALRPEERFQSAMEMLAALKGQTRRISYAPSAPAIPTPGEQRTLPWRWMAIALSLIAVLACVGGGALLLWSLLGGEEAAPTLERPPTVTQQMEQKATSPPPRATEAAAVVGPTSTPIPHPTGTPLPHPTDTPLPHPTDTPIPRPTDTPTITPTPTCPPVGDTFAAAWETVADRLGCARNSAHAIWMAHEHFERGEMFWREDTDTIMVLYADGRWNLYADVWHEGEPEFSCPDIAPSQSPPTPRRGFGKVWCLRQEVRQGLGNALDAERGFSGTVQDFETGTIIRTDLGETYILHRDGWARP